MTTLLLNFGHKDGPEQVNDYKAIYLFRSFMPEHLNDRDDYELHGIGKKQYSLSAAKAADLASKGELFEAYEGTAVIADYNDGYCLINYRVPSYEP